MDNPLRYRAAFDAAPIGLACLDLQGRVVQCNRALRDFLGYPADELIGARLVTAFTEHHDAAAEAECFLQLVDGKRTRYHLEKRFRRKDGRLVWGSLNVALACGEDGQTGFCLSTIEDITARRRQEEQLRHGQKMEALSRIAGEVVYRLNHMMLSTLGSSQMLLDMPSPQDRGLELVETIREAVDRTAGLTRQLVAFCSRQIFNLADVDLNVLLGRMTPRIRVELGEGIDLVTEFQPALGRVRIDQGQVERVILTMVTNARDAMTHGGKLTLKTANIDSTEFALVTGTPASPQVMLAITDNGCGMDDKTRERLFEPFFTTREQGKSSGLGLAAAHGIVKQLDGLIEVASQLGHGTTFRLYLPRSQETVHDFQLPATLAETRRGTETILVVEDDDNLRGSTRRLLQAQGYQVLEARYGGEALLLCLRHEGPIHLMITDTVMQHLTGRELADQVSSLRPDLKVLFLSSQPLEPEAARAGRICLQKPFTPDHLVRNVREVLSGLVSPSSPSSLLTPSDTTSTITNS